MSRSVLSTGLKILSDDLESLEMFVLGPSDCPNDAHAGEPIVSFTHRERKFLVPLRYVQNMLDTATVRRGSAGSAGFDYAGFAAEARRLRESGAKLPATVFDRTAIHEEWIALIRKAVAALLSRKLDRYVVVPQLSGDSADVEYVIATGEPPRPFHMFRLKDLDEALDLAAALNLGRAARTSGGGA